MVALMVVPQLSPPPPDLSIKTFFIFVRVCMCVFVCVCVFLCSKQPRKEQQQTPFDVFFNAGGMYFYEFNDFQLLHKKSLRILLVRVLVRVLVQL